MPMMVKFYQSNPENPENPENPDSDKLENNFLVEKTCPTHRIP